MGGEVRSIHVPVKTRGQALELRQGSILSKSRLEIREMKGLAQGYRAGGWQGQVFWVPIQCCSIVPHPYATDLPWGGV